MREVVFCTFSKNHGLNPGLIKHGYMELSDFEMFTVFPEGCVRIEINQLDIKIIYDDNYSEDIKISYWGLSKNIYEMSNPIEKIEFPFVCKTMINVLFGEYEE
jgi:hypothetical protein